MKYDIGNGVSVESENLPEIEAAIRHALDNECPIIVADEEQAVEDVPLGAVVLVCQ